MKLESKWSFLSIKKERKNNTPKNPRKGRCQLFALEYINYKSINSLPINFEELYEVFDGFEWIICEYEEAKELLHKEDPLNIRKRNALARTFHERGSKFFLTVYIVNDVYPTQNYFTIAHELGHIILGHFIEFENTSLCRGGLSKNEYSILEREADIFAAEFIMPVPVLKRFKIKTADDIVRICNVSRRAAHLRFNELIDFMLTIPIQNLYWNTKNLFINFIDKRICLNCKSKAFEQFKFCPICGHNRLVWGDGTMNYNFIELNEKHKAKVCPICGNENTDIDGEFCQICGTHIANKCTDCGLELTSDARYCPHCGNPSTFYNNSLLQDWKSEKDEIEIFGEMPRPKHIKLSEEDSKPEYEIDIIGKLPF